MLIADVCIAVNHDDCQHVKSMSYVIVLFDLFYFMLTIPLKKIFMFNSSIFILSVILFSKINKLYKAASSDRTILKMFQLAPPQPKSKSKYT